MVRRNVRFHQHIQLELSAIDSGNSDHYVLRNGGIVSQNSHARMLSAGVKTLRV